MRRGAVLLLAFVAVAASACTKKDSLILLELRSSGPLGAPVARVRLSAKGWPTRTIDGTIGLEGLRVGYYGPGDGSAIGVVAEALDGADCVLGSGSAAVPALEAGATSAPTKLFVRAVPANGCVPDAGPGGDAGKDAGEDAGTDAGTDAEGDAAGDAGGDVEVDSGVDAEVDAGGDVIDDAGDDGAPPDAPVD